MIRSQGYEVQLVQEQLKKCVHIFSCDGWIVVSDETVWLLKNPRVATVAYKGPELAAVAGESFNSAPFRGFWFEIQDDGQYAEYDWTVKVDPDTVFFPDRLRSNLAASAYNGNLPTIFANCDTGATVGPHDGRDFLYGPIEVISRAALDMFFKGPATTCSAGDKFEETYLTNCMASLGIELTRDTSLNLLRDDTSKCMKNPSGQICTSGMVAMHPFSGVEQWFKCWEEATV